MKNVAQKYFLSILLITIATSGYAESFAYSCLVKGDAYFTSFDFSYGRPPKWPGDWRIPQPIITTDVKLIITGYGKIKSILTATAEGPPYNLINLSMQANMPTQGILTFSLLEDANSNSAWGFGKYKKWQRNQYEDQNLFILCER